MIKKIAIFRTSSHPLDINNYNVQEIGLANGLLNQGISVDIYSRFTNIKNQNILKRLKNDYIKLIPIKGLTLKGCIIDFSLKQKILNNKYDIVQVHEDSQIMTPLILKYANNNGIKTVLYQGMYKKYVGYKAIIQKVFNLFFLKMIRNNCDFIFAKTNAAQEYLINEGFTKNIYILPVGLNYNIKYKSLDCIDEVKDFKSRFDYLLLYLGILERRRNISFLIDVLNILRNENIGLIIVGKGPSHIIIKEKVKKLELEEKILMIDIIPNNQIKQLFDITNLFVIPSLYEIFGMVILESLYFGLPVLSSKTAGANEILKYSYLGTCLELNVQKWAEQIKEMLLNNYNKENMRNYILKNYNWDDIAKKYCDIVFI